MTTSLAKSAVHILGSGSIGLFLAARGAPATTLLLRDHHRPRVDKETNTIPIDIYPGTPTGVPERCHGFVQLISDLDGHPIRQLVLTTKAFDALSAVQTVQNHLEKDCQVLILCNGGLAVRQELRSTVSNLQVGSVTHGVYRVDDDDVDDASYGICHAGVGKLFLPQPVATDLIHVPWPGMESVSSKSMERILWQKLAANAVCNPLTALYQCTNGQMAAVVPDFDQIMHGVTAEMVQVQQRVRGSLTLDETLDFVQQVIADNADNRSSMHQDVFFGRPTEIMYLNGYIVQEARRYGVPCPYNTELVQRIQEVESKYRES